MRFEKCLRSPLPQGGNLADYNCIQNVYTHNMALIAIEKRNRVVRSVFEDSESVNCVAGRYDMT